MSPFSGMRCLVVDDEPRLRRVLIRLLEGEGFVCREAGSGVEALALLEQEPVRSEEHTSELQSLTNLVFRLLLAKKNYENLGTQMFSRTDSQGGGDKWHGRS